MNISVSKIFREPDGVIPNTIVLIWTTIAWLLSFTMMGNENLALNITGVVLCIHSMVLAAYLVHEAAHFNLFVEARHNCWVGEWMSFIAGASYASFDRIRRLHIRHHRDRADVSCFDFKYLIQRFPWLKNILQALEWAYFPATELLMHLQVIWRPLFVESQRKYRTRSFFMLIIRSGLMLLLAIWSMQCLLMYVIAYLLFLHVLNFFDAFHHTFEQFFVDESEPISMLGRDRSYEQANTFSNLVSKRYPILNLLTLNFCYHNAHHERAAVPWYRLPKLHRSLYGAHSPAEMPLSELLKTWHRNRVRRVIADDYGTPGVGASRADAFIGAHGVSFLTVV